MKTKLLTFLVVAWFSGVVSAQNYDFGDLPDSPYPTKLPNGARHIVSQSLFIGSTAPDFEADGNALASALGDDAAGIDDEDGVTPSALLITAGVRYNFRVKATNTLVGNAWLHAFADWNQDGDFADPNEYANVLVPGGSVDLFFKLPFDVPPTAITGAQTALRLRLSSDSVLLPTGAAQDGEVEDSLIPLHPPGELKDYGDLPDSGPGTTAGVFFTGTPPNYRTLLGDGGPSHGIKPEINFSNVGSSVDAEVNGQPNADATGDDTNNDPDEAGMVITTSSVVFRPDGLSSYFDVEQLVELPVTNITGSVAKIGVFIDVNSDGDFDDADEQSFNTVPGDGSVIIRSTLIKYKVPAAPPAMNFARYFAMRCRITTDLAVGPDGVATDGEVIDKVQQLQFSVPAGGYDPLDLGDHAGTYPTLRAINGARHVITPDIFLGTLAPDGELDGQPSALADGDDTNGVDDENAVNASSLHLIAGFSFNFPVLLTNAPKAPAVLTGFFDWNNNGVFEPTEASTVTVPSSVFNVVINLPIAIPATASSTTPIAARLRLATSGTTSATGVAPNGEVEDLFINLQAQGIDYGDLPDAAAGTAPGLLGTASPPDYKTRSADGGPSHIMRPGLLFSDPGTVLGNLDPEPDGQPSAMNADGDDTHGESDEIGLFSALSLSTLVLADGIHTIYEHRLTLSHGVINTTGSMAHVSCFLDVNSDGDFADPGEQAPVIDVPGDGSVAAVTPVFTYNIMYQPSVKLAVRSRITTDAGITSGGPASDGEVQDDTLTYSMSLPPGYELTVDYGDLNAARYPTLYASNGARHVITQTLFMGANVPDGEPDANASLAANGDDTNGSDDEDGFNPTAIAAVVNQSVNFPVMVSNATGIAAKLYGFVDWNDDGDLADPGESANIAVPAGAAGLVVMLPWAVPAAASTTAPVAVRLRLSHDAALGPMGYASDGEVEDYLLNVYPGLDFGDLPDPYHTTLLLGPRHVPGASLFLGTNPGDYENDGQPTALANGDDANTTDDEDGLNPATVTANTSFPTVLPIKATNTTAIPARLFVFVDWNADGDFLDVSETNTVIVPPASINVLFNVPFVVPHTASVAPNGVAVRLRLSTAVALGPDGVALDGEVEDYFITAQHFYDFGDLPDSVSGASAGVVTNFSTVSQGDYQTRLADNGARHVIRTDLVLFNDANPGGIHIDPDTDGHPSADATGDDADADDDEELFLSAITRQSATNLTATTIDIDYELYASLAVKNETGVDAYLTGFLDANNDGDFSDFGETKTITVPSAAGFSTQNLTFTPKLTLTKPTTVWTPVMPVRFRFSTQAGLTAAGEASDGEVEDYMVTVSFSVSEWWPKIVNNPSHDFNADIGTPLPLKTSKLPPMFGQANDQTWKIGPATLQGFDPVISTGLLSSIGLGVRTYSVSAQLAPNLLLSHSGLIKIGSLDDFRSFMSQHSITGSAASPDEDSDGDGISNFAEFVFGTDPGTVNQPPRFEPKTVNDTGGNYFTLPYLRRTGGTINGAVYETPDAHYIPQASNDLADWTKPITNVPPPSGLPTPPAGYEWGAVRIPTALSGGGTGFVRLNVLLP